MGSFKNFLNEQEDENLFKEIHDIVATLGEDELNEFGYYLYSEFFDEEEGEEEETPEDDEFTIDDVMEMIAELGPEFYGEILDMLDFEEDDIESHHGGEDIDNDIQEGVSRIMRQKNFNRKKRKFMSNTKADMRRTKAKRKMAARQNRAKRKRYYRANKKKISAYQKSRNTAISKGKHKVKLRRPA